MTVEQILQDRVRQLLEKKSIDVFLGYRAGNRPSTAVAVSITRPEEADRLILNQHCEANLATYLLPLRRLGRIGVLATGATSRSVVNLLKERQLERKNLFILGVADPAEKPVCPTRNPVIHDEMLGEQAVDQSDVSDPSDSAFEAKSPQERWELLSAEISRCIRCYACRQVCPNCYCPTCFVDASQPGWVGRTNDESDNVMFHIMRAMHMAGRCVECGACARACPMGIDLMRLNRKVARIVRERFNHVSGMNLDDPLPLTTFSPDDVQEFIK